MKVTFIGLGAMGYPMAGHLQQAGYQICVYNRTRSRSEKWLAEYGGDVASSPRQAAEGARMVFACVGNDDDVRQIALGADGAFSGMQPGAIFIDHTTASAQLALELTREAASRQLGFMDAPVSGGQQGAKQGRLTIMCGGDSEIYAEVEPVMAYYARFSCLMGPVGSGQICKMVNQICVAGLLEALAEGLHFANVAGLDARQVVEVISKGAAQSWQMDNRHQTMLAGEYQHGFAVDWMRKDLGIILRQAETYKLDLPVTRLVDKLYGEVQSLGGGRWDTSSLLERLVRLDHNKLDN